MVVVAALAAPAVVSSASAAPGAGPGSGFTGRGIAPTGSLTVAKSTSGKLAQTDPALLNRSDSTPLPVVVKLDYDAAASYNGDVNGLPATSPTVTGRALDGRSPAEQAYADYTAGIESTFVAALHQAVPAATV